jgi:3-hydroxyacyl-CoA dehydrogenase
VGFHFFNPVAVMPLLEVIKAEKTDDAALATAFAVGKQLGKTTILVKDSASFVANRLLGRFMGEISKVVDEGTPIDVADGSVGGLAPMPPFVLLALVGPAIALHNSETLHGAFGDRFYVSENLRKIVEAKKPAIYVWDSGKPEVDPDIAAFFEVADPPTVLSADEVRERVLSALADEARRILDEGVVAAPEDIDLAMITGAGFQFWNGGITPLLDRTGYAEKVTGKRFLAPGVASVPA